MSEMPNLRGQEQHGFKAWWKSGDPWIWITGGGVAIGQRPHSYTTLVSAFSPSNKLRRVPVR